MCALTAAFEFGTDMIKLSTATLAQLLEIQLDDLATFLEHQSAAIDKITGVHDVAGLLALQKNYRDAFWDDRLNALVATRKTLQVALERVGQRWSELTKEEASSVPPLEKPMPRPDALAKTSAPRRKTPKTSTKTADATATPATPRRKVSAKARSAKKGAPPD